MATKRPRASNFQREENEILCQLVEKYKHVIENKCSDGTTWKKKETAWSLIEEEFNAQCGLGGFRCAKTLKNKYETLKRMTRKKSANIRLEMYKTGGGPNDAPTLDPVEEKIKSMILISCSGNESVFDSDVLPGTSTVEEVSSVIIPAGTEGICTEVYPTDQPDETGIATELQLDLESLGSQLEPESVHTPKFSTVIASTPTTAWDAQSRKKLRNKINPALKCTNAVQKKIANEALEARLELINLQKKLVEEERVALKSKQKREEEEHQKKMEILELELEIKKKHFERINL